MSRDKFLAKLKDEGWVSRYQLWLNDPITGDVLDMAQRALRPVGGSGTEDKAHQLGLAEGTELALEFITTLADLHESMKAGSAAKNLPASYGSLRIMMDAGYTEEEAKKAIQEIGHAGPN